MVSPVVWNLRVLRPETMPTWSASRQWSTEGTQTVKALLILMLLWEYVAARRETETMGGLLQHTPAQAAVRELEEETGLFGKIEMLLGVTSTPSDLYDTVLMVGYLVKSTTGRLQAGDDASDVAYVAFEKLPEIAFESHRRFVRMYYAGGF